MSELSIPIAVWTDGPMWHAHALDFRIGADLECLEEAMTECARLLVKADLDGSLWAMPALSQWAAQIASCLGPIETFGLVRMLCRTPGDGFTAVLTMVEGSGVITLRAAVSVATLH